MTRRGGLLIVLLAIGGIVLAPEAGFAQCPMCRRALESPGAQELAATFRSGILFLLAAPFVVFGAVATVAVRATRRRQRASRGDRQ